MSDIYVEMRVWCRCPDNWDPSADVNKDCIAQALGVQPPWYVFKMRFDIHYCQNDPKNMYYYASCTSHGLANINKCTKILKMAQGSRMNTKAKANMNTEANSR